MMNAKWTPQGRNVDPGDDYIHLPEQLFEGEINHFRVVDRALTREEIYRLYRHDILLFKPWYSRLWFWTLKTYRVFTGKENM